MWGPNSIVPGAVKFTIVNRGTAEEGADFKRLISRAASVASCLTGQTFIGDMNDYLEFVSADEETKEAVFRLKK